MEELIKYFESLEARISALEAEVAELKSRPLPEPQVVEKVVEKIVEVEKPVEVIKEVIVEKPVEVPIPPIESDLFGSNRIESDTIEPAPIKSEEQVTPNPSPVPSQPTTLFGSPVSDIRKAISIGDRFLFQRELFAQNGELMQKTLDALNVAENFEAALAYIDKHFSWDKESATYDLFLSVLKRRFA